MKIATFLLALLSLSISGCGMLRKGADADIVYEHSPAGHRFLLHTDNGSIKQGLFTMADLGRWLDNRIEEWVVMRAPTHGGHVALRSKAREHTYRLVDHFEVSRNGRAVAGQYDPETRLVVGCIYGYTRIKTRPASTFRFARPVGDGTSDWYHEVLKAGNEIPVIGHELDHAIGIGHKDK